MSEERKREKRWVPCGYIMGDKDKNMVKIMVSKVEGAKEYYIADLNETLEALTGRLRTAKLLRHV
jgi:hypothetical protein